MSRQDQRSFSLVIDGESYGIWDSKEGGGVDSEESKYPPGAMGEEIDLGGRRTFKNINTGRLFDLQRDLPKLKTLLSRAGKARGTATELFLDTDGNVFGQGLTYRFRLKAVNTPLHDSKSSEAALIEVELSVDGIA